MQKFHSWVYIQKNPQNTNLKRYMHPNIHRRIIYNYKKKKKTKQLEAT